MSIQKLCLSRVFQLLVFWRLSSVFIVQTADVPDEYWQSLEVAHKATFDYGYLTWEWQVGIRSFMYPFIFSILYYILKITRLDYAIILIYLPRVLHSLVAAYADYKFYKWTGSKAALFNLCINWFWYYYSSRTLINNLETCLSIVALSEFPWSQKNSSKFLWYVGFICAARPTAALIWLPFCIYHIFKYRYNTLHILKSYVTIGLFYSFISTLLDCLYYGKFIITPWNFVRANVLNRVSEQYGIHNIHWYMTSALPVLLGLNFILLPLAVFRIFRNHLPSQELKVLLFSCFWTIGIYSLLAHKEFRFILPVMPMFIYIVDKIVPNVFTTKNKTLITLFVVSNLIPGLYFSLLHQRGSLKVMSHLRNHISDIPDTEVKVLFLTRCHSLPFYSHLHKNVSMEFLTCEPNLEKLKDYICENDLFFNDPVKWIDDKFKNIKIFPSHIVTYDTVAMHISQFLRNYTVIYSVTDRHFPEGYDYNELVLYEKIFYFNHETENKLR